MTHNNWKFGQSQFTKVNNSCPQKTFISTYSIDTTNDDKLSKLFSNYTIFSLMNQKQNNVSSDWPYQIISLYYIYIWCF